MPSSNDGRLATHTTFKALLGRRPIPKRGARRADAIETRLQNKESQWAVALDERQGGEQASGIEL